MDRGFDFLAETEAALKKAAAAACEHDRLRWVHVAQVWQDLSRCAEQVVSIVPKAHVVPRLKEPQDAGSLPPT
jgi:hypothetical protein